MKSYRFRRYIHWGVTVFLVIAACIGLQFLLQNLDWVRQALQVLNDILAPVIYGAVLAYLLTPVYNHVSSRTVKLCMKSSKRKKAESACQKAGKFAGTVVSLVLLMVIVVGLFSMLLPEIVNSTRNIVEGLPASFNNLRTWLTQKLANNPGIDQTVIDSYYTGFTEKMENWLYSDVIPNLNKIIISVSTGAYSVIIVLKNILIGLVVMIYLLNIKSTLQAQGKKIIYGVFPLATANKVVKELRFIHKVFGGFIIGKLLDSLIIGIICFIGMSIMKMPYVVLVSVIIGVTNVIPFFGPFIGAVPAALLILTVSPLQCLYFLLFILLLQQFDGNILGPKILGDSTGLSSFWVLFSILLFGGLFGFVGMIIAVPTFAVFYKLLSEFISNQLAKKQLDLATDSYMDLGYIDENTKTYQKSRGVDEQ